MTFIDKSAPSKSEYTGVVGLITIPSCGPPFGYLPSARLSKSSTEEYLVGELLGYK